MSKNSKFSMSKGAKISLILTLVILLFPVQLMYKDGGTKEYRSIVGIYSVIDYHRIAGYNEYLEGCEIQIFGITVYKNTYIKYF